MGWFKRIMGGGSSPETGGGGFSLPEGVSQEDYDRLSEKIRSAYERGTLSEGALLMKLEEMEREEGARGRTEENYRGTVDWVRNKGRGGGGSSVFENSVQEAIKEKHGMGGVKFDLDNEALARAEEFEKAKRARYQRGKDVSPLYGFTDEAIKEEAKDAREGGIVQMDKGARHLDEGIHPSQVVKGGRIGREIRRG